MTSRQRQAVRDNQPDAEQRHGVDDLDERVDRRPRRVLGRVADGIADDRRRVGRGVLAPEVTALDQLLRVVPRRSARGHHQREREPGDHHPEQQARERHRPEHEADRERTTTEIAAGTISCRSAVEVTIATQVPYSGARCPARARGYPRTAGGPRTPPPVPPR